MNICMVIYLHVLYELLKWHHNAFHMHWGNIEVRCECMTWFFKKRTWLLKEFHRMIFRRIGLGDGPKDHFG